MAKEKKKSGQPPITGIGSEDDLVEFLMQPDTDDEADKPLKLPGTLELAATDTGIQPHRPLRTPPKPSDELAQITRQLEAVFQPDEARLIKAIVLALNGKTTDAIKILKDTNKTPVIDKDTAEAYLNAREEYEQVKTGGGDVDKTNFRQARTELFKALSKSSLHDQYFGKSGAMNTLRSQRAKEAFANVVS